MKHLDPTPLVLLDDLLVSGLVGNETAEICDFREEERGFYCWEIACW
ncbi:MAG: hypothetical protein NTV46_06340 [Verrucomicrobia bacterium]|nr:hypothetical protein [Verrucomicrobiota bacterium]